MEVIFTVNGIECRIKSGDLAPDMSLNIYLRTRLCLTGTKFMCQEGGCGCCIVSIRGRQPVTGEKFTLAVNSCLFLVFSCHGLEVTTIEGLGNRKKGYHPMQERLAHYDGSQCGYCSPGFVMNMYSLYEGKFGSVTDEEVEDSFGGNICRCTGYRPILDAFKSFASNPPQGLTAVCEDIEELSLKKCPSSGKTCTGRCEGSLHIKASDNAEWHKVTTLSEVLQLLRSIDSRKYRLVAGNTAHGIYQMPYDIEVFIDVSSVTELRRYSVGAIVELGGNITITEWMRILLEAADHSPWFNYCRQVRDHLNRIATVPVRNVGTIAGNLMIKHEHRQFYSDVFLLLETVGAQLTITDSLGNQQTMSPEDFLSLDMEKKVITKITMPHLAPNRHQFRSYKITDRAQNAITYMNAGFLMEMNVRSSIVISSKIVYGGVNPYFVHASSVEKYLKGMDLSENTVIQSVVKLIDTSFNFDDILPNSSPEFRQRLAIGLFYKTVLTLTPSAKLRPSYQSGATSIARPLSSGQQKYNTVPEKYPLTQPIMKVEALIQCSGEAEFVNDIFLHNALWGAFVLATEPLKTISSIDPCDALDVVGVKAFYSSRDIPGVNSFTTKTSPIFPNSLEQEEVFCSGKVLFHGQPVGVVVAEEMSQAVYAASLVKIHYTSEVNVEDGVLPSVEAVLREDPKLTEHRFQIPMVIHAATQMNIYQDSHHIKDRLFCGSQYPYYMETQQTVAVPAEDGMEIYPSTQWIDFTNMAVAHVLGIPNNAITIRVRRIGGGYGVKATRSAQIAAAAAVACYHQKRPVRMVLPMKVNMQAVGKRTPSLSEYDVDFNDQGVILRLNCDVIYDLGCSSNELIDDIARIVIANAYSTQAWTVIFHHVTTEAPSNTYMRAPGTTEIIGLAETIMEHIAWTLKKDPVEVRLANLVSDGPIKNMFTNFLKTCEFYKRRDEVKKWNIANRWKKRGIAITLMQYPHENVGNFEALVAIYHGDGSVVLNIAAIDMGQGLYTKMVQIAASTLGIPLEKIRVVAANNVIGANSMTTSGSLGTDSIGYAVKKCCETLKERLEPFRIANPTATWGEHVQAAFLANTELIATYQFKANTIPRYFVYGCACAEIEIDILTGNFQLHRVDIVEDTGESISPRIDAGQVEGAFIMGLGYWLHEKLVYNRTNGELLTNRAWNYKPPGAKDIPVDFRVTLQQTNTSNAGIVGSKVCGESAVSMAVVVISALRQALEAARRDAGAPDKFLTLNTATTVETILELAGTKDEQFIL